MTRHAVHYTPSGGALAWCGRAAGFHAGIPATKHAERVTCKQCLVQIRKFNESSARVGAARTPEAIS